jgi:DNA-binding NtrC family response regulator
VARGTFREDLFYRLNVLPLAVPPLRERRDDIEALAHHFFVQFERERSPRLKGFSRRALLAMQAHSWPGNVRELMNRVRRAMVMAEGRLVALHDLGLEPRAGSLAVQPLMDARTLAEKSAIALGLMHAGENVSQTARNLGVSRMTLYRLMSKHGLN